MNGMQILSPARYFSREQFIVAAIVLARVAAQLVAIDDYGYFIDEFYYIACSERLAAGYVDHPPLSIWVLKLMRLGPGDSLAAIRLAAVLAGAATVYLSARLARVMGGGTFAVSLTALATAFVPIYLGFNKFYSMNSLDLVFWTASALVLARIVQDSRFETTPNWIVLGVLLGLGLLNKHSMLFFGFALLVGLLATRERRLLLTAGPYLAGTLALLLFLPNLIWQFAHDWPTLEFMANARAEKNYFAPLDFIAGQILEMHPLLAPLWLFGLFALLFGERLRAHRVLGWIYLALFALFMLTRAKTYYLSPAYPMLLAAGATAFEQITQRMRVYRKIAVPAIIIGGLALLPMSLPLLAPERYIAYQRALGIEPPKLERHVPGKMPQHFAGMFGWTELVDAVTNAYRSLPEAERPRTVILAGNYGLAGALELARGQRDLPAIGSGHNNYYLWGPPRPEIGDEAANILAVGFDPEVLAEHCQSTAVLAVARCEYCMAYRHELPVMLCTRPRASLREFWPRIKRYI